jgi:nucleoside-diphosphate-sugar epimerase
VVVHLAGLAHLAGPAGRGRLDEFLRANAELAHTLGRAMVATGRPMRLVFMSSVGAVASFAETPLTDETEPRPDSDYGRSKLAGERAVIQVLRSTCVDWCILRPPLVYGPGDRGNLQRLAALIRKGCPLPLGAIRSRRSFVYVGNLVDAIERCATAAAASRRTYFVADDEQTSLVELMEGIGREMGRPARIVSVPLPVLRAGAALFEFVSEFRGKSVGLDRYAFERLTGSLVVDSSSLQRELAWRPPYTMQSGLCATFSHGT